MLSLNENEQLFVDTLFIFEAQITQHYQDNARSQIYDVTILISLVSRVPTENYQHFSFLSRAPDFITFVHL